MNKHCPECGEVLLRDATGEPSDQFRCGTYDFSNRLAVSDQCKLNQIARICGRSAGGIESDPIPKIHAIATS